MKKLKIAVKSDFIDYYDYAFDSIYDADYILKRYSRSGMNRIEMFDFLKSVGLKIPKVGTCSELTTDCSRVVVYLDVNAHRGEGKILLSANDAKELYPHHFASEYIPLNYGISYRLISIGKRSWMLRYSSNDWRSNCGEVKIELLKEVENNLSINRPLYAIDFVGNIEDPIAIDFNIAPQVKGTGLGRILKPKDVYQLMIEWYETNSQKVKS